MPLATLDSLVIICSFFALGAGTAKDSELQQAWFVRLTALLYTKIDLERFDDVLDRAVLYTVRLEETNQLDDAVLVRMVVVLAFTAQQYLGQLPHMSNKAAVAAEAIFTVAIRHCVTHPKELPLLTSVALICVWLRSQPALARVADSRCDAFRSGLAQLVNLLLARPARSPWPAVRADLLLQTTGFAPLASTPGWQSVRDAEWASAAVVEAVAEAKTLLFLDSASGRYHALDPAALAASLAEVHLHVLRWKCASVLTSSCRRPPRRCRSHLSLCPPRKRSPPSYRPAGKAARPCSAARRVSPRTRARAAVSPKRSTLWTMTPKRTRTEPLRAQGSDHRQRRRGRC
jgi:hypothetical protein